MSKSILVIDTPNSCSECNDRNNHFTDNTFRCEKVNTWFKEFTHKDYLNKRHPQCPLQDTTVLLEALEEMRKCINQAYIRTVHKTATKSNMMELEDISYKAYNKLYKALGGNVDE